MSALDHNKAEEYGRSLVIRQFYGHKYREHLKTYRAAKKQSAKSLSDPSLFPYWSTDPTLLPHLGMGTIFYFNYLQKAILCFIFMSACASYMIYLNVKSPLPQASEYYNLTLTTEFMFTTSLGNLYHCTNFTQQTIGQPLVPPGQPEKCTQFRSTIDFHYAIADLVMALLMILFMLLIPNSDSHARRGRGRLRLTAATFTMELIDFPSRCEAGDIVSYCTTCWGPVASMVVVLGDGSIIELSIPKKAGGGYHKEELGIRKVGKLAGHEKFEFVWDDFFQEGVTTGAEPSISRPANGSQSHFSGLQRGPSVGSKLEREPSDSMARLTVVDDPDAKLINRPQSSSVSTVGSSKQGRSISRPVSPVQKHSIPHQSPSGLKPLRSINEDDSGRMPRLHLPPGEDLVDGPLSAPPPPPQPPAPPEIENGDHTVEISRKSAGDAQDHEELISGNNRFVRSKGHKDTLENPVHCFVTFLSRADADACAHSFTRRLRWIFYPFSVFFDWDCFQPPRFKKFRLQARRAKEPSDIRWENLAYSPTNKIVRNCITKTLTLVILFLFLVVLYLIEMLRQRNEGTGMAFAVGVFVAGWNQIIQSMIIGFAFFEKHSSKSAMEQSIASTKFWTYFIHLVVIMYLLFDLPNPATPDWYARAGILITSILISEAGFCLLLHALHPFYRAKHSWAVIRAKNQQELNKAYAGPKMNLWNEYASFLVSAFIAFLFTTALPLLTIISTIKLIGVYLTEKYNLLRKYQKPSMVDTRLAEYVRNRVPLAVLAKAVFAWISCRQVPRPEDIRVQAQLSADQDPFIIAGAMILVFVVIWYLCGGLRTFYGKICGSAHGQHGDDDEDYDKYTYDEVPGVESYVNSAQGRKRHYINEDDERDEHENEKDEKEGVELVPFYEEQEKELGEGDIIHMEGKRLTRSESSPKPHSPSIEQASRSRSPSAEGPISAKPGNIQPQEVKMGDFVTPNNSIFFQEISSPSRSRSSSYEQLQQQQQPSRSRAASREKPIQEEEQARVRSPSRDNRPIADPTIGGNSNSGSRSRAVSQEKSSQPQTRTTRITSQEQKQVSQSEKPSSPDRRTRTISNEQKSPKIEGRSRAISNEERSPRNLERQSSRARAFSNEEKSPRNLERQSSRTRALSNEEKSPRNLERQSSRTRAFSNEEKSSRERDSSGATRSEKIPPLERQSSRSRNEERPSSPSLERQSSRNRISSDANKTPTLERQSSRTRIVSQDERSRSRSSSPERHDSSNRSRSASGGKKRDASSKIRNSNNSSLKKELKLSDPDPLPPPVLLPSSFSTVTLLPSGGVGKDSNNSNSAEPGSPTFVPAKYESGLVISYHPPTKLNNQLPPPTLHVQEGEPGEIPPSSLPPPPSPIPPPPAFEEEPGSEGIPSSESKKQENINNNNNNNNNPGFNVSRIRSIGERLRDEMESEGKQDVSKPSGQPQEKNNTDLIEGQKEGIPSSNRESDLSSSIQQPPVSAPEIVSESP